MKRWFALTLLLGAAALGSAQRAAPDLRIFLDEKALEGFGPIHITENSYLVPVRDFVRLVLKDDAQFKVEDNRVEISVNGRRAITIPVNVDPAEARVFDPSREGAPSVRTVPLYQPAAELPGRAGRLWMDLDDLAGLLGVAVDREDEEVRLFTPEFWCAKLGIKGAAAEHRNVKNLAMTPEFGVSPPAQTLILWARPSEPSYVQFYKLGGGTVQPLFYYSELLRQWRTHESAGSAFKPRMRPAEPDDAMRAETRLLREPDGNYGQYALILSKQDLGGADPVEAINSGRLADGQWAIVGLRQRFLSSPVEYTIVETREGDTFKSLADQYKMEPDLLRQLNGLRGPDTFPFTPGQRVLVIRGLNPTFVQRLEEVDYQVTGIHMVQAGQSVVSLARQWGVTRQQFFQANPQLAPGTEVLEGELVTALKGKAQPAGPAPGQVSMRPVGRLALMRGPLTILARPEPGAPTVRRVASVRTPMTVLHQVEGRNFFQVSFAAQDGATLQSFEGYVEVGSLVRYMEPERAAPPPIAGANRIAQEALQWLGTPYQWGGNQLGRGIDCSHFVAAVLRRATGQAPAPPVVNQERFGSIVHWKPGEAWLNGRVAMLDQNAPGMEALAPGDRMIIQRNPLGVRSGSRHTGVYIGPVSTGRFGAIRNGIVHASSSRGVVVEDMTRRSLWRDYRYTVRGNQPRVSQAKPTRVASLTQAAKAAIRARGGKR